ncbi:uncharacterized protein LOC114255598 [Monomorium pharaonis]|uniref:uncharacterized protein LOC114255598 n=1 Tax=Monomorium pharaonis TaxID=307658 RepID=UPI0017478393|nr:uncharacterized protein LOC114255598 [Monomorium pharaonis]
MLRVNENTLELDIKVNGQNLSTVSKKYNIGTLRIPSDPSWPKIPLRCLSDNTDDIIEHPCVITLTEIPRKSPNTRQTVANQHFRSRLNQKYETTTHIPKKLPSCFDPRFRRQVLQQKIEKLDEFHNSKDDEQLAIHVPKGVKEDKSRETDNGVVVEDDYVSLQCYNIDNLLSNHVTKSMNKTADCLINKGESISEANHCITNNCDDRDDAKSIGDICISKRKSNSKDYDEYTFSQKEKIDSNVSLSQDIINEITLYKDRLTFNALANADDYSNLNTTVKLNDFVDQSGVTDSYIAEGYCNESKISKGEMAKIRMHSHLRVNEESKQKFAYRVKNVRDEQNDANKLLMQFNIINDKRLTFDEACLKESEESKCNDEKEKDKKEKRVQLRINAKKKCKPASIFRKAKSFFRKKSRLALANSNCTLILPGHSGIIGKRSKKICEEFHSKVNRSLHGKNGINSANSILEKYVSRQGRINFRSLTNLPNNLFEKQSSIPLETRELLNKNYWKYYWNLRRKMVSAKSAKMKKNYECLNEDHLSESQTLRQCSVLSCMINMTLRDSTVIDGRQFSDPKVVTSNACIYEASESHSVLARMIKRKKLKRESERLLGFRAIALLCIAMYVAVIFLPVMYHYLDEEYNDGNANYLELIFQYVTSFEKAFDEVINALTTILLRPVK